jgi:hypothetical protein
MACDCIERIEAELQKNTGDNEAFVAASYDIKAKIRRFSATAYYRGKIGGIIFKKNFSSAYLNFDYCPFCGKKYEEGLDEVQN